MRGAGSALSNDLGSSLASSAGASLARGGGAEAVPKEAAAPQMAGPEPSALARFTANRDTEESVAFGAAFLAGGGAACTAAAGGAVCSVFGGGAPTCAVAACAMAAAELACFAFVGGAAFDFNPCSGGTSTTVCAKAGGGASGGACAACAWRTYGGCFGIAGATASLGVGTALAESEGACPMLGVGGLDFEVVAAAGLSAAVRHGAACSLAA